MAAKIQPEINKGPDFQKIYSEMVKKYHPDKENECKFFLVRTDWSSLDIINVSNILFGQERTKEVLAFNQKQRAYDEKTIVKILTYQKLHRLNDSQTAIEFRLSRNSLRRWRENLDVKTYLFKGSE